MGKAPFSKRAQSLFANAKTARQVVNAARLSRDVSIKSGNKTVYVTVSPSNKRQTATTG